MLLQARPVKTVNIRVRLAEDLHGQDRQLRYRVIDNWGCYRLGHRSVISVEVTCTTWTLPTVEQRVVLTPLLNSCASPRAAGVVYTEIA
jgi:hypothetical protein